MHRGIYHCKHDQYIYIYNMIIVISSLTCIMDYKWIEKNYSHILLSITKRYRTLSHVFITINVGRSCFKPLS